MIEGSLRGRLTGATVTLVAVLSLSAAAGGGWQTVRLNDELQDSALAESGQLLLALAAERDEEPGEALVRVPPHTEHILWQILRRDGTMIARSHHAPYDPLLDRRVADGFHDRIVDGRPYRIYGLADGLSGLAVRIAVSAEDRARAQRHMLTVLITPVLLALVLLAVLVPLAARRSLAPLEAFSGSLTRREAGDLSPLPGGALPAELAVVRRAIDGLLERLTRLVERDRHFAANAAHELKTPLAAARAQAQLAQCSATGDAAVAAGAAITACDRMAAILDRLLALSRARAGTISRTDLRLDHLVGDTVANFAIRHAATRVDSRLQAVRVRADPQLLEMAIGNLLENAARHAPGSPIRVETCGRKDRALAVVEDAGPGMPEALMRQRPEPFMRGDTAAPGHGLGLALVARIAEAHGGHLRLARCGDCGLRATIELPAV